VPGEEPTGRFARLPMNNVAPEESSDAPLLVSVIIATLNEAGNIEATIKAIFKHVRAPVEVVVVDDNSPDGTAEIVEAMTDSRVSVIKRQRGRGLASAVARGIMKSRGDIVCWIDADMSIETKYLPVMIEESNDHDVVIASRFVEGGGDERHWVRVYASHLLNGVANLVLGYGIKDYDSCVVAVRRSVFDDVTPIAYGYGDFFIEFAYDCCRNGFDVVEVPYVLRARDGDQSKSFPSLGGFLWLGFKYCARILSTKLRPD